MRCTIVSKCFLSDWNVRNEFTQHSPKSFLKKLFIAQNYFNIEMLFKSMLCSQILDD